MDYCTVENGVITNLIVCEDDAAAKEFGALPAYDGAAIGEAYTPPAPPLPPETYSAEDMLRALAGAEKSD